MLSLTDALIAERQQRQFDYKDRILRRQMAHEVLRGLGERLAAADVPRWQFIPNGDEIVVLYHQPGHGTRERVGAWIVDEEFRLSFGEETTEWITSESWSRVLDKAVLLMATVILDRETQVVPFKPAVLVRGSDQRHQPASGRQDLN